MTSGPIRVAVFGSFYRGYYVLWELLFGRHKDRFQVVGVATDGVGAPFISADRRVWQYPHSPEEESMVETLASSQGIPVHKDRVKTDAFYARYEHAWAPDLCISATFGQRIDERLFGHPRLGFFNIHPCIPDGWPSRYAGPNPFQAMKDDGCDFAVAALHRVDAGFDTGELIAVSRPVAFPPHASVVDMHKITSSVFATFAVDTLLEKAGA